MSSCDNCHEREAVVHLTELANEKPTTTHLCGQCAAERGVSLESPLDAQAPLGSLIPAVESPATSPLPAANETASCASCGATMGDIRATGRVGCPDCWRTFERPLKGLVKRIHGAVRHVGSWYPANHSSSSRESVRAADKRLRLEQQLRDAVSREAFERAAELRDQLASFEAEETR